LNKTDDNPPKKTIKKEIIPGVWLGESESATVSLLTEFGIQKVINVTVKVPFPPGTRCAGGQTDVHVHEKTGIVFLRIPVQATPPFINRF